MPNLLPYRDYDEKDVIAGFTVSGQSNLNKGHLVKILGGGLKLDTENPIESLGDAGDFNASNTVSLRYGVVPKVGLCGVGEGDVALGFTLFDIRETDENGEQLKYRPRKAAEMEAVISGQSNAIVRKGIFAYDGLTGTTTAGSKLYAGADGTLDTVATGTAVATALGDSDADGNVIILLHCE